MSWPQLIFVAWAAGLALWDGRYQRLPNWATFGAMGFGLLWLLLAGRSFLGAAVSAALVGGLFGFFVLLPPYAMRMVGAGDVKFLMAIGLLGGGALAAGSFLLGILLSLVPALFLWLRSGEKPCKVPLGFGFGLAAVACLLWPDLLPL